MLRPEDRFLIRSVKDLVDGIEPELAEGSPHVIEIDKLFKRCRTTFGAIALLLENEYADEAIMLGRALFTDSLALAELAKADESRRVQLMVGLSLRGVASLEGIVRGDEARGDDVSEELGWISLARSNVERYARDSNVGTKHWKVDDKALADAHGRGPEYADFRLAHLFVHGGLGGVMRRYGLADDDEVLPDDSETAAGSWTPRAARFAARSMLHACRSILQIHGRTEPDEVGMLFALEGEIGRRDHDP